MAAIQPDSLSNLRLWLRPDSLSTLSDGDRISSWSNEGSLGGAFTGSGDFRPIYKENISPLGQPGILFQAAGTFDCLYNGLIANWKYLHNGANITTIIAYQLVSFSDAFQVLFNTNNTTSASTGMSYLIAADGKIQTFMTKSSAGNWLVSNKSSNTYSATDTFVYFSDIYEFGVSGDDSIMRVNGTEESTFETINTPHLTGNPTYNAAIGRKNGGGNYFDGYLFEVISYEGAKSTSEVEGLEQYIVEKYKELPSTDVVIEQKLPQRSIHRNITKRFIGSY